MKLIIHRVLLTVSNISNSIAFVVMIIGIIGVNETDGTFYLRKIPIVVFPVRFQVACRCRCMGQIYFVWRSILFCWWDDKLAGGENVI